MIVNLFAGWLSRRLQFFADLCEFYARFAVNSL